MREKPNQGRHFATKPDFLSGVVEKSPENAPTAKSIVPFSEKIKMGSLGVLIDYQVIVLFSNVPLCRKMPHLCPPEIIGTGVDFFYAGFGKSI